MHALPEALSEPQTRAAAEAAAGRRRVTSLLADGRLCELWPRVLVPRDLILDPSTRQRAALLFAGPDAALSGSTAAGLHGCPAAVTPTVHVILPYSRWHRSRAGLVVHHGRLPREDCTTVRGMTVVTLEAAVTDLLCTERARLALAVADQAAGLMSSEQRAEFCDRIARRLATRADRRGTARAANLLDLVTGKADSPPESWLRLLVVEAGYPPPEAQIEIRDGQGRLRFVLDLGWRELRVALEYDGYESHELRKPADQCRDEDLRRRGWWIIRVTADDFREPTRLLTELARAFRARGAPLASRSVRVR